LRNFNVRAKTVGPGVSNNFALLPFFWAGRMRSSRGGPRLQ
jgi:hypothetical protein